MSEIALPASVGCGCCALLLATFAAEVYALVWAVTDITSTPELHRTWDIAVFIIVGMLFFGNVVGGARVRQ